VLCLFFLWCFVCLDLVIFKLSVVFGLFGVVLGVFLLVFCVLVFCVVVIFVVVFL